MLMLPSSKRQGFTIVELLIVIVVIAILATISIVAYRGIQDRAYAAKVDSAVDAYAKLFEMYKVDHGSYPEPPGPDGTCLGKPEDYQAVAGKYAAGACGVELVQFPEGHQYSEFNGAYYYETDPSFNNMLEPYASALPDASLPSFLLMKEGPIEAHVRGVLYSRNSSTGQLSLYYYKKGSQPCSKGVTTDLTYVFMEMGEFTGSGFFPTPPGGQVDATACRIILEPGT